MDFPKPINIERLSHLGIFDNYAYSMNLSMIEMSSTADYLLWGKSTNISNIIALNDNDLLK